MASSGDLVTRMYNNFRGVDFRGLEVDPTRSPDSVNMWIDYKKVTGIETRPGMILNKTYSETVYGIFFYKVGNTQMRLVHSGTSLYKEVGSTQTLLKTGLMPNRSQAFVFNNIWYFKDGINYLRYDGQTIADVTGYVPTTSIGRKPEGGGAVYEDVNMLTGWRINTFCADGKATDYYLDSESIDTTAQPVVMVNDTLVTAYTIDTTHGIIKFDTAPPEPLTDGQDNVSIKFRKTIPGYRDRICKCNMLAVFDNRVFFGGNMDYPNAIFHTSLNDPTYCSDLDYYNEGDDNTPVKAIVPGNNALWVFKAPSQANTTVFYHNPVVDSEYGKIYPSTHSSISTGCLATGINFNDDIVFFSERGMEGISGDVTTEQVLAHRSTLVDTKLLKENDYEDMVLEEYDGYLFAFVGKHCYIADSRGTLNNINHMEYEWFYWELGKKVYSTCVFDGEIYLGTNDGIYTLNDEEGNVDSYWTTPVDRFNAPQYNKTSNKRGCTIEATGDITVSVKTNKSEWELIASFDSVRDYLVARIKRKKFKDLQLKFSSETRFSLESATFETFVGGYIKR